MSNVVLLEYLNSRNEYSNECDRAVKSYTESKKVNKEIINKVKKCFPILTKILRKYKSEITSIINYTDSCVVGFYILKVEEDKRMQLYMALKEIIISESLQVELEYNIIYLEI